MTSRIATETTASFRARLATVIPIIGWLPSYRPVWLKYDIVAGLTLAAYAVPVAMAYATLAGLSPQVGLYCYLFAGLIYAIFASSRHLAMGPTAAISVMIASVAGPLAGGDPARYATLTALTALVVALISITAWLLRLSSIVNFISETTLLGFKAGAALSIAATQLPKLFGASGGGDNFFSRTITVVQQLGQCNPLVVLFSLGSLVLLLAGQRLFPGRPVALVVVLVAVIVASLVEPAGYGIAVIGIIPHGLPRLSLPPFTFADLNGVVDLAFACFLLSYIESISAAKTFALKYRYPVDPGQELLALGLANAAAALGQGYPVGGGLSQSAVNDKAGARTPLSLIVASGALAVVLIFLTGLLHDLPEAVLAAVVFVAVMGFIDIKAFVRLWKISRLEFTVALAAFGGVLLFGILKGVAISVVASLLLLLQRAATPHVATLGRIPGTERYSDLERHQDNETIPGIFLFRVEAAILYFNQENVYQTVIDRIHAAPAAVRLVICDLSTSPYVDSTGGWMLARLAEQLTAEGIRFRIAEAHAGVRDLLRAAGLEESVGGVSRYAALPDLIDEFLWENGASDTLPDRRPGSAGT